MTVILPRTTPRRKRTKAQQRTHTLLRRRRRRILNRIAHHPEPEREVPMISASNIHYELGQRVQGLASGGIGAMLRMAST